MWQRDFEVAERHKGGRGMDRWKRDVEVAEGHRGDICRTIEETDDVRYCDRCLT
jgi:hypothetical protein